MSTLEKLKWLLKLNTLTNEARKANDMGYDLKIGAAKALRDFVITSLAVGGAAILSYFSITENLAKVLGFLPDNLEHASIAVISPLIVLALNYLRERGK